MVNTYWHDWNLTPSDYLTTSSASSTYVPYTWASWDVNIGTHSYEGNAVTLNAEPVNDWFILWPELLNNTWWTVNSWTGSWSSGWLWWGYTILSRAVSIQVGHKYLLSFTSVEAYSPSFSIWWFSWWFEIYDTTNMYVFTATTTDWLSIEWDAPSELYISIKEIEQDKLPIFSVNDQNWINSFNIYSSDSTLKNLFMWKNTWAITLSWVNNLWLWDSSLSKIISWNNNIWIWVNTLSNVNQNDNIWIWVNALNLLDSWLYNIGIWSNVLCLPWYSYWNTAIWYEAMKNYNWNGSNTAIWFRSMSWTVWASNWTFNVAIWSECLFQNTTWWYNVWLWFALDSNTTWSDNIGIGYSAWWRIASSSNNQNSTYSIFIGRNTRASVANWVNEIVIWYQAVWNGSNTVTLGHTDITKTYLRWDIYPVDWKNIVLGSTWMKIWTTTSQKLWLFWATPVAQQTATTDLWTALSNIWLRAAGTAYPITTSGALSLTWGGTISGTISLGTASTQVITNVSRMVFRTAASDPQHATPASRPAWTVWEIVYYSWKMYFCTNASTPTWEKFTST